MEFIRVSSNKWSKNQDLCTFIIKFSQLVRLFFVCKWKCNYFAWQVIHIYYADRSLCCVWAIFCCFFIRCVMLLPLPWHLHFDCFVVVLRCCYWVFFFSNLTCISPSHKYHQDKYSILYSTPLECKWAHLLFFSLSWISLHFAQSAHSAVDLTVWRFFFCIRIYIFNIFIWVIISWFVAINCQVA